MENKLYHLNPNTWGQEYYVLAESKEKALEYIVKEITIKEEETRKFYLSFDPDYNFGTPDSDRFKNCTPDKLPGLYTLDEYGPGKVIQSEIA